MAWVKDNCISFIEFICIKIIKTCIRVPKHVAFIMDGNRRYARKDNLKYSVGHSKGFDIFSESLRWCLDLGVQEVTVYAFSIENFNRSDEEVKALFDLARKKFQKLLDEIDRINALGMRVSIAGRLSLLPRDVRALAARVMLATKHNTKLRVNIACAYTGRDEISRAASCILDGVKNNELKPEEIDTNLISQTLDFGEPGLLVRTSGEVRLSDFMMWQVSCTVLYFTDVLWPEFTIWNLFAAIIHFVRHAPPAKEVKPITAGNIQEFLDRLEKKRWQEIEKFATF